MFQRVLLLLFPLFLSCCSTPDQYYRLTAPAVSDATTTGPATGLGPVSIPSYVDRPELVFESDSGQLQVPAGHRWSGPLQEEVTRVLAAGVQAARPGTPVLAYPWPPGTELARNIPVAITAFHATSGTGVHLSATWETAPGKQRRTTLLHPIQGDGYAAITRAQSAALAQLATKIAASF